MADPSLPLVMRSWCIEKRVCFASSLYNSSVLALDSIVIVSGKVFIGLPDIDQYMLGLGRMALLTPRTYLQFNSFTGHIGRTGWYRAICRVETL